MNSSDLKYLAKQTLGRWGWRVERETQTGWQPGRTYWEPAYLQRWKMHPATIIDVGVGHGTPHLYEAFPDAFLVLVEPLREFDAAIAAILARRRGVLFPVAVGAAAGERAVHVEAGDEQRSSFYTRHALEAADVDATALRQVPLDTLDRLLATRPDIPRPFGLKIDAEGAELDVIRGATRVLAETEFVIAEVNVLDRFDGGYSFAELVAEMARAGFAVRDVLGLGRADSSEVTFLDLVFQRSATR